jgi:T5SS/PEP-CTERM-associated repeat protein
MRRQFLPRLAESFVLRLACALALILSIAVQTTPALAQKRWQGFAGGNNWFLTLNWEGGVPVASDNVLFPSAGIGGWPHPRTTVGVPADEIIINSLRVDQPFDDQFTFVGSDGVINVTTYADFETNFGDLSFSGPDVVTGGNIYIDGSGNFVIDSGSTIRTTNLSFIEISSAALAIVGGTTLSSLTSDGELFIKEQGRLNINANGRTTASRGFTLSDTARIDLNSGGELIVPASYSGTINSGTLNVNSGSTLTLGANTVLNLFSPDARINFVRDYNILNNAILNVFSGGDVVGSSYIDVGNGGVGRLALDGLGSTFSALNFSDWGLGSAGDATIDIENNADATVQSLGLGTNNARASATIDHGTLTVNGTLTVGGGATVRPVRLEVSNSGLLFVSGTSTFNNQADVNLVSGTIDFNSSATFNAGSRLDITGGTLDTNNQILTLNGGTLTRTTSGALSSGSELRVQAGGTASFSSYFDIGSDNSAALTVTGNGSTYSAGGLSDWGRGASGGATVSIDSNAIATLDRLRIGDNNGTASVTVASGAQLRPATLTVGGGSNNRTVNLTINGGTLAVTDPLSNTAFNDKAVLNLQSGTFDPKGNVTFLAGSVANISGGSFLTPSGKTLTVSGGTINRTITAATGISTGSTLAINSAGTYASVGSYTVGESGAGTVTVDGANSVFRTSTDLTLGGTSTGQVGTVTTTNGGRIHVGDSANQSGVFAANDMFVSDLNTPASNQGGFLRVSNGSTLTHAGNMLVATQANQFGQVSVDGTNSQLIPTGLTVIGRFGSATLDVQSGGAVRTDIYVQSFDPGSNSTANVSGASSLLEVTGNLVVGRASNALMNISAGARVESGGTMLLGELSSGNGTIYVTGADSTLVVDNAIEVGLIGGGTLDVHSGGDVTADIVTVGNFGTLYVGDASVSANVTLLNNSQTFADNATVGPLTQQAGAELIISLRGTSDFDNLHVLGPAILHGELVVRLGSEYTPQSGDSFEFLTSAGEIIENFSNMDLPALSEGLEWQYDYSPQALTLSIIGGLPGDFDFDGDVDGRDFLVWQRNTSVGDLEDWQSNYGTGIPLTAASTAVPEPGSFALLGIGMIAIGRRAGRFPGRDDRAI